MYHVIPPKVSVHIVNQAPLSPTWYDVGHTSLGKMILFATREGIIGSHFCTDDVVTHVEQAIKKFDLAHCAHNSSMLKVWWEKLATGQPVTVLVQGTPFEQHVWQSVCQVNRGTTCSYQALASIVRFPKAVRAVANAVAKNFVAYLVPCHRIIRSDGSLGGYRWGLAKKKMLLQHENT